MRELFLWEGLTGAQIPLRAAWIAAAAIMDVRQGVIAYHFSTPFQIFELFLLGLIWGYLARKKNTLNSGHMPGIRLDKPTASAAVFRSLGDVGLF